jgi:two-component system, NarL family, nitrate/nitrite response regulator NarL
MAVGSEYWKAFGAQKLSKPTRIVVADDHAVLLESITALLETQPDFAVVGKARSGAEALEVMHRERPDIMVLDLVMPNGNGFEVLRELDRANCEVAAVILTGSINQFDYVQAVKLGARGLVLKGDGAGRLFAAIRTVANGELAFSEEMADHVVQAMADEPTEAPGNLGRLSERERQIAALVGRGMKNRVIAGELKISENTVKRHLQSIFSKTGAHDRLELAMLTVTETNKAA